MAKKNIPNEVTLTKKQIKVLKLVCQEYNSKEIAERLGLSFRTIEGIRHLIVMQTRSKGTIGIVKYAIKNKIYILK